MNLSSLADALGLAPQAAATLRGVADFPDAPPAPLGGPKRAAPVLDLFGLEEADRADLVAHWPDARWPKAARWLVDACYARIVADVGRAGWVQWPEPVSAADARVRCSPVYAFVAAAPLVAEYHRARGVGADVTAATLADVGRHMAKTRRMFGRVGLELPAWIALHYRGSLYEVGRLQYEPSRLGTDGPVVWYPDHAPHPDPSLAAGRASARLHIPATGPLEPGAVDDSLARARGVLGAATGQDVDVVTCSSWLLDPRLRRCLGADSNIVAFQERFTLVQGGLPGNADVFRFVFDRPEADPAGVRVVGRLQRGVVDLLERGESWQVRTGWLRLP